MLACLAAAANGETREETARRTCVSVESVKFARKVALRELRANSLPHAVAIAYRQGLL
jgi:DNA-binding CsgD family transcriptional regulator